MPPSPGSCAPSTALSHRRMWHTLSRLSCSTAPSLAAAHSCTLLPSLNHTTTGIYCLPLAAVLLLLCALLIPIVAWCGTACTATCVKPVANPCQQPSYSTFTLGITTTTTTLPASLSSSTHTHTHSQCLTNHVCVLSHPASATMPTSKL